MLVLTLKENETITVGGRKLTLLNHIRNKILRVNFDGVIYALAPNRPCSIGFATSVIFKTKKGKPILIFNSPHRILRKNYIDKVRNNVERTD